VLTRNAQPGDRFQLAVFGINGPISASPRNYIWMRTATLDFYARERAEVGVRIEADLEQIADGFDDITALLVQPDESLLIAAGTNIYRWSDGVVTVFRPKSYASGLAFSPEGLLMIEQRELGRVIRVNPHGDTTLLDDFPDEHVDEDARRRAVGGGYLYAATATSVYRKELS
jgi:gluconolactonase